MTTHPRRRSVAPLLLTKRSVALGFTLAISSGGHAQEPTSMPPVTVTAPEARHRPAALRHAISADGNNNISPGQGRAIRVSARAQF